MTRKSWERTDFPLPGANCSTAGAAGDCPKRASSNHTTLPFHKVLSDVTVLSVVILSVLLVVIS